MKISSAGLARANTRARIFFFATAWGPRNHMFWYNWFFEILPFWLRIDTLLSSRPFETRIVIYGFKSTHTRAYGRIKNWEHCKCRLALASSDRTKPNMVLFLSSITYIKFVSHVFSLDSHSTGYDFCSFAIQSDRTLVLFSGCTLLPCSQDLKFLSYMCTVKIMDN